MSPFVFVLFIDYSLTHTHTHTHTHTPSLMLSLCLRQITNLHGSRVLDILFIDLGIQASVEVIELREFPPPFLRDLIAIPPQVCPPLAELCWAGPVVVSVV